MRNLYVDPNTYDLTLEERNLRLTVNTTEWLSAKLEARLKTFLGEWFANNEIGVPYYQEILKKQVDIDNVQSIFSEIIKETPGVEELLTFNVAFDNSTRTYSYDFRVLASTGDIIEGAS
jgi:hypothetical protein